MLIPWFFSLVFNTVFSFVTSVRMRLKPIQRYRLCILFQVLAHKAFIVFTYKKKVSETNDMMIFNLLFENRKNPQQTKVTKKEKKTQLKEQALNIH